jgi:glycosyltransferase involved in cell wall biosynthesis
MRVAEKYGLKDPFVLYLGGFDVRKNVETLLRAYKLAREQDPSFKHQLVLVGSIAQPVRHIVPDYGNLLRVLGLQEDVHVVGYVEDEDLPAVYNLADLFVYPSRYEGFGLPVLEAMRCGTPVIAGETSSIPEILSRDDLLFDPDDVPMLARKMVNLIADGTQRTSVSKWGIEAASRFSWADLASKMQYVYHMLSHKGTRDGDSD